MLTGIPVIDGFIIAGSVAAALTAIFVAGRGIWRFNHRIVHISDLVRELRPNGGGSIKDQVTRIDEHIGTLTNRIDTLTDRLDRHIDNGG